jgi:hypothetical protein
VVSVAFVRRISLHADVDFITYDSVVCCLEVVFLKTTPKINVTFSQSNLHDNKMKIYLLMVQACGLFGKIPI